MLTAEGQSLTVRTTKSPVSLDRFMNLASEHVCILSKF
jgi:hypothetical protein